MRAYDRVTHGRVPFDLFRGRWKGALAAGEIEYRAPARNAGAQAIGQRVPRRCGAGEFSVAERQPMELGDFDRIEDRPARRSRRVAHIAVPVLAGAADTDRLSILGDV